MNVLASNMEELKFKELRTRKALRKRMTRSTLCALVLIGILVILGIKIDKQRREFLTRKLSAGDEAERKSTLVTIAKLNEKKLHFEQKLEILEGKKRYQLNRNKDVDDKTTDIEKRIDAIDIKWLMDKAETERCFDAQVTMKHELDNQQLKEKELKEESTYCKSRLRSQELELNELKHFSVGSSSDKGITAFSTGDDDRSMTTKEDKPVYLGMKYNNSIRKSMILRQVYSAAGGLALSVLLRGMSPLFLKLFGPRIVVPPPIVPDYRRVEMAIVDTIFGSSVAFLLARAVAMFALPL